MHEQTQGQIVGEYYGYDNTVGYNPYTSCSRRWRLLWSRALVLNGFSTCSLSGVPGWWSG